MSNSNIKKFSENISNFNLNDNKFISNKEESELTLMDKILIGKTTKNKNTPPDPNSQYELEQKMANVKIAHNKSKIELMRKNHIDKKIIDNTFADMYEKEMLAQLPEYEPYKLRIISYQKKLNFGLFSFCGYLLFFLVKLGDLKKGYYLDMKDVINNKITHHKNHIGLHVGALSVLAYFSYYNYHKMRQIETEFKEEIKPNFADESVLERANITYYKY